MTREDALAEARSRWGHTAQAVYILRDGYSYEYKAYRVGYYTDLSPFPVVFSGDSWEEAFENADRQRV